MLLKDIPGKFVIDGREGNRVGYWCSKCQKAIPVKEKEIDWEFASQFANGIHRNCNTPVESIWENDDSP